VYVVTENDTVYALDASAGTIVWQQHLGTPVSDSVIPGTGNINPTVGITSTPVIDPTTGRIYVVADTWDGSTAASVAHEMFALNLSDGSVAVGPVPVDPPGSTHTDQLQRTSLALDSGKVIIGYGGNDGDQGNYHGWEVAVPEGGGPLQSFEVDSQAGDSQGAIWAAGNAPAIDSSGDIWVATGNGSSTNFDFSESVIRLDPNLSLLDWWAPSDWSSLDGSDTDLGSSMPLLLPGGLVFQIGKSGIGYLLSASNLGHTGGTPAYSQSVCGGSWGGGIYYNGVIYVTCSNGLHALALNASAPSFSPLSGWTVNSSAVGPPIEAGGLIWSAGYNNGILYGLNPSTGATSFSSNLGGFKHFMTPSAGGGLLFVANVSAVTAFKIANGPPPSPTGETLSSSANPAAVGQTVTLTATVSPTPDAGTVAFTDGGAAIPGCGAVAVNPITPQATCMTSFGTTGQHPIVATYSGDAYYTGSSASLTQGVASSSGGSPGPGPTGKIVPVISKLRARALHRKLQLKLVLSTPAKLTIVLSRNLAGRIVHRRCRAGARRGRRCTVLLRKATFTISAKQGANTLTPRMRALAPGPYTVTVTGVSASGGRSRRYTVTFVVPRP
jgi:outer membrane protein assembly factor BamB